MATRVLATVVLLGGLGLYGLGGVGAAVGSAAFYPDDWQAKWITANRTDKDPLPIFRKTLRLATPVKHAIVHICGLGHYELRINGRRVGDREMGPNR